jgi:regulatory protein YycI of two-component signal transduction system YycFG
MLSMIFIVFIFLVINLFLTVYCAVSVYQIKHSTTPSKAVQMEELRAVQMEALQ